MHVCICEYKSVFLYRFQKNQGLDIVPSTFIVNKTQQKRKEVFCRHKQSILFARRAHQHFIQAFSGQRLENFKKFKMIRTSCIYPDPCNSIQFLFAEKRGDEFQSSKKCKPNQPTKQKNSPHIHPQFWPNFIFCTLQFCHLSF